MRCSACRQHLPEIDVARFCPTCGAELPEGPEDTLIGSLVGGRFRITRLIAEGGMGRIYAAEQPMGASSRTVAIKMLLTEYATRSQDVARFMRECSTVCELEHPNTIKFHDYGQTEDGDLYIAMEYLIGETLAATLKSDGALAPERVDWIVGQICGSLQEAHDKGIIHRDLKPDNILLTHPAGEEDIVKVLDFGIAKRPNSTDQKLTPLGVVLGSPPYMSPEQFSLQDIDHRSDIYSVGMLTYQALAGRLPFNAKDMLQWATLHMTEPPLSFADTEQGRMVPTNMQQAVQRALSKLPSERPQSMREFYELLTIDAGKSMPPFRRSDRPHTPVPPTGEIMGLALAPPPPPSEWRVRPGHEMTPDPSDEWGSGQVSSSSAETRERIADDFTPPPYGRQGTMRLPSALPPPVDDGTVDLPELIPPTVRDPRPRRFERNRKPIMPMLIMVVGAALVAGLLIVGGAFLESRDTDQESSKKKKSKDKEAPSTSAVPALADDLSWVPELPSAFPTATPSAVVPVGPIDPCKHAVVLAINGDCVNALKYRLECAEDHPDHALAHRAYERRCGGQLH